MGYLILIFVVVIGGLFLWTQFQGKATPDAPDINPPNPGDIISGADDAARAASKTILGLPPEMWSIIVPLVIALIIAVKVWNNKALRMAVIVIGCLAAGVFFANSK